MKKLMRDRGYLPYKVINEKTDEIMGIEKDKVYLGFYCIKRDRVDLVNENLEVYMSLDRLSVIPMHVINTDSYSLLSKHYAVAVLEDVIKRPSISDYKIYATRLGVSVSTFKNWSKNYHKFIKCEINY